MGFSYEGRFESNASCSPPPSNYNYSCNEIYTIHGYSLYKINVISPQILGLSTHFLYLDVRRCRPVS